MIEIVPPEQIVKQQDWTKYVFAAVERETHKKWKPKGYVIATWVRSFKQLRESGLSPYTLALGLDLLALKWDEIEFSSLWATLSIGAFTFPFRQGAVRWSFFSRAVWFSRYANSDHEVQYYQHWMSQAESAMSMDWVQGSKELLATAKEKLKQAETMIRKRGGEPSFKMHWLKGWVADESR